MHVYKRVDIIIFLFITLTKGMESTLTIFGLKEYSFLGFCLMEMIFASVTSFTIAIAMFYINDKAFTNFLGTYSMIIGDLHWLILNSLLTVTIPSLLTNFAYKSMFSVIVALTFPLIPFFVNLINKFSIYKEAVPKRKKFSMMFAAAGVVVALSLSFKSSIETGKSLNFILVVLILVCSHTIYSIGERISNEYILHLDPWVTPLLKYLISGVFYVILIVLFDSSEFQNIDEAFLRKTSKLILPGIIGIFSIAISYHASNIVITSVGFSAYSVVYYSITIISLFFSAISMHSLSPDLPITFSFLISIELQFFAMLLDFVSPVVTSRKDERNRMNSRNHSELSTPYASFNQIDNEEKIPDDEDQII